MIFANYQIIFDYLPNNSDRRVGSRESERAWERERESEKTRGHIIPGF